LSAFASPIAHGPALTLIGATVVVVAATVVVVGAVAVVETETVVTMAVVVDGVDLAVVADEQPTRNTSPTPTARMLMKLASRE
jgi:hypothetical protein